MLVTLEGDLGTGKTTLVRGVLRAFGWTGSVKSPTYTLVEHYVFSSLYFYHFDLYRVTHPDEWDSAGFSDYLSECAVALVEWPDRVGARLARPDLRIALAYPPAGPDAGRLMVLDAFTDRGAACLSAVAAG